MLSVKKIKIYIHNYTMLLKQVVKKVFLSIFICTFLLSGCAEQITKHGQLFKENDLQQIQPGMGQEQVRLALGTPTTTTTTGSGQVFYYISSTMSEKAFFSPQEIDRNVIAVYFTPNATVERVANYGLKDGKIFDFISATTPAPGGKDEGILKQLFRNLGKKQLFME